MKKNISYLITIILSICSWLIFLKPTTANADGAGFTVSAVIPSNQYTNGATYFDLKVSPGQTQTIYVNVSNLTNKTKKIVAYPNTSYTSDSGVEAYDKNNLSGLSTAPALLSDVFGKPQTVTVGPKATKQVAFTLKMPTTSYKGILEGAFYFLDSSTSSAQATNQKGVSVKNRFALALGVVLREDTSTIVAPSLKMNAIKPSISDTANFSPAVSVNLENTKAAMLTKLRIKAEISRTKGSKVLYKSTQKNMGMAPDSNFNYSIDWNNDALKPGTYHLHLVATSGELKWVFDRNFTITANQAQKVNKKANVVRNYTWLWITLGVVLLIIIMLITFLLGRLVGKRKNKKNPIEKK